MKDLKSRLEDLDEEMFRTPNAQFMMSVLPRRDGEGYECWSGRFQVFLMRVERRQSQARSISLIFAAILVAIRWEQMTWKSALGMVALGVFLAWASARAVGAVMYSASAKERRSDMKDASKVADEVRKQLLEIHKDDIVQGLLDAEPAIMTAAEALMEMTVLQFDNAFTAGEVARKLQVDGYATLLCDPEEVDVLIGAVNGVAPPVHTEIGVPSFSWTEGKHFTEGWALPCDDPKREQKPTALIVSW
jgi:hypothetical protein